MLKNFFKIKKGGISLDPVTVTPADAQKGDVYLDSSDNKLKVSLADGTVTEVTTTADIGSFLKDDGSVTVKGNLIPDSPSIRRLGEPGTQYSHVHTSELALEGAISTISSNSDLQINSPSGFTFVSGTPVNNLRLGTNVDANNRTIDNLQGAANLSGSLDFASANDLTLTSTGGEVVVGASVTPQVPGTKQIGTTSKPFGAMVAGTFEAHDGSTSVGSMYHDVTKLTIEAVGELKLTAGTAINVDGKVVTGVASPSANSDATNKQYVDNQIAAFVEGLKPKQAARVSTQANVDLSTELEDGDVVDGITLATGDRVLVRQQSALAENGIYVVQATGAAVRAVDFDAISPVDEINGASVAVQEGTDAGKVYVQTGKVTTVDVSDIEFVFFNSSINYIAGDGIDITGNTISAKLDGTTLVSGVNGLAVNATSFPADLIPDADSTRALGAFGLRFSEINVLQNKTSQIKMVDEVTSADVALEVVYKSSIAPASSVEIFLGDVTNYKGFEVSITAKDTAGNVQMTKILIAAKTDAANSSLVVTSSETAPVDVSYQLVDAAPVIKLEVSSVTGANITAKVLKLT